MCRDWRETALASVEESVDGMPGYDSDLHPIST
jgi:hypothetical protein